MEFMFCCVVWMSRNLGSTNGLAKVRIRSTKKRGLRMRTSGCCPRFVRIRPNPRSINTGLTPKREGFLRSATNPYSATISCTLHLLMPQKLNHMRHTREILRMCPLSASGRWLIWVVVWKDLAVGRNWTQQSSLSLLPLWSLFGYQCRQYLAHCPWEPWKEERSGWRKMYFVWVKSRRCE